MIRLDYAWIEDGVVTNVIWLYPGNADEFPNAVPLREVPVTIGDTYEDGVFHRNGDRLLSPQEALSLLMGGVTE